ncbi:MAG: hypothetical protein ACREMO_13330 [Gemmatimonadales bacterium]
MPVTAKLSRRFYEALGDDVANELVDWINQVDLAYRVELRELNDRNFARFEAKLEQRLAEVKSELRREISDLRGEMQAGFASMRAEMAAMRADIIKWMFLFWAGTALTVIGLLRF